MTLGISDRKVVLEMTYNVLSGMLNPAIPYHTVAVISLGTEALGFGTGS